MRFIKLTISIFLLLITCNVMASHPILYSTIKLNKQSENSKYFNMYDYNESEKKFPIPEYGFILHGYDLKYDSSVPTTKRVNLKDFRLRFTANLKLLSFDRNSGNYKFELTFEQPWLEYTGHTDGRLMLTGGEIFKRNAKLKLPNGNDPRFTIEGKYNEIPGKHYLHSFNINPFFDIEFSLLSSSKTIYLKKLRDFPVVVIED